jgi:hypothetical protein
MTDRNTTLTSPGRLLTRGAAWFKGEFILPVRRALHNRRLAAMAQQISANFPPLADLRPVVFFRASSGIQDFSYNNAFHTLAAWGLRLQRVPVIHFACRAGMTRCVLGTVPAKPGVGPPCAGCIRHSSALLRGSQAHWFGFQPDDQLRAQIRGLSVGELEAFTYEHAGDLFPSPIPLGSLVVAGLRWRMRRHHLLDDDATRSHFREYIVSAWNVAREFASLVEQTDPQAVVVFNGQFFPEATAAWVAHRRGLKVITHEVGLQPFSAYFTAGEATAYPIHIPDTFQLTAEQNTRLDEYLSNRFQGNFTMAGVRFWPQMKGLDEGLLQKINQFDQVVPVFTNVVFDTSQPHANTVFPEMFAWLGMVQSLALEHPQTLFIIRAHPDEARAGKQSRESVQEWVEKSGAVEMPNVVFIAPGEHLSSYELIQRAKFVMIYNSTIGLEAAILGAAVLCAGKARFTQYPTVFFPQTVEAYALQARTFLAAESIEVPDEFRQNARRFLYYQLYKTSLPFNRFLDTGYAPSMTRFTEFSWRDLLPENSAAIQTILDGILEGGEFLLP